MTRRNELDSSLNGQASRAVPDALTAPQSAILEARRLRAETLARLLRAGFGALVRGTGFRRLARLVERNIVLPIERANRRRRTIAELSRLDERMLNDIGLSRADIGTVASDLARRATPAETLPIRLPEAVSRALAAIRAARARGKTIRELKQLPDRLLADIGIARDEIESAVDRLFARQADRGRQRRPSSPSPAHGLRDRAGAVLRALRQWRMSRRAAGQMARFDAQVMADLGYVKGDIDWVPEAMAQRELDRAANRNAKDARVA
ncbi:MAG: DUF1127 domain-containing protein [Kiloniellaceae bacterium]